MPTIYEFDSSAGIVRVEASEGRLKGPVPAGRSKSVLEKASKSFEEALSGMRPIAEAIISQTTSMHAAPKSVEAKFGIKIAGEMGAILAKTAAEAHVEVKLTWDRQASE